VAYSDHPGAAAARTFASPSEVGSLLRSVSYLPTERIETVVHLAARLGKPVLVEGPAGAGKTELARSVARMCELPLIRLQCYEGLDEAKALYEWDYRRQLLHIQMAAQGLHGETAATGAFEASLFGESFRLTRPLLEAIRAEEPVVLLVDEVDRLDFETEALLLEVLSDYAVSIPELGTVTARSTPLVFLTSNASRDLSEPLRRRCLYLHLDYPTPEREREILTARVPHLSASMAEQAAQLVHTLRSMELKKRPSVAEAIDWARTLVLLGVDDLTPDVLAQTAPTLLKHRGDIATALEELGGT
jgi:MoxR-like ATPase